MAGGRPTKYTPELATMICDHIADGKSLRKIMHLDGMPERRTIMEWETKYSEFADQIARARDAKTENDAEALEDVNDWVLRGELEPAAAAVISNNIKWVAGKLKPKKYGDSINQKHTDGDGKPLKTNDAAQAVLAVLTTEQLEKALAEAVKAE